MKSLRKKKRISKLVGVIFLTIPLILGLTVCKLSPETATVFFVCNGGSSVPSKVVEIGSTITEPETPERTGFNFDGWYSDSGLTVAWDFPTGTVTKDMTLYAKWIEHWIKGVAAGEYHTIIVKSDGTAWSTGNNQNGELGIGTTVNTSTLTRVMAGESSPMENVTAVSAGANHSLLIKLDGSLMAVGNNGDGQLGDNTNDTSNYPVAVLVDNVAAISAGYYHTMLLKQDDTLWGTGNNDHGELGNGTTTDCNHPYQAKIDLITLLSDVASVSAGAYHTMILLKNGTVRATGLNSFGQLGDGTTSDRRYAMSVKDGTGNPMTGVAGVAAGLYHSIILKQDGTVWAFGTDDFGQLGSGTYNVYNWTPVQVMLDAETPVTGVIAVSAGDYHTMFLRDDGTLWGTGRNWDGQLGDGTDVTKLYPVQVMLDGLTPMTDVIAVAAGATHTLIIRKDGTLWAFGDNAYGQLGDGTTTDRYFPVEISEP